MFYEHKQSRGRGTNSTVNGWRSWEESGHGINKLQKLDNTESRLDNLHKSIASLEEPFAFLEKDVQNLKDKTEKNEDKGRRA